MVYNFMQKDSTKTLTPQEFFPLEMDKGQKKEVKRGVDFNTFKKIFTSIYSRKNESEISS